MVNGMNWHVYDGSKICARILTCWQKKITVIEHLIAFFFNFQRLPILMDKT
jgi:hypothetical protein